SIYFKGGVVTGDFATPKLGYLPENALDAMTVCTQGELEAIAGTGPDTGKISSGANPLVVCDGGTNPAYTSQSGLTDILDAETASGGATTDGADGTPVAA